MPNHLHVEWALRALNAGKHVLVEKPVAMQAADIAPLIAARDATGLIAAEAYMIVHHPQWQMTRRLLAEGAIGRLRHADVVFSFDIADRPDNIRNRPETGGGVLGDIGVYAFGCLRWATGGEPASLTARIHRDRGVDVQVQAMGEFEAGFSFGTMISTCLSPRQEVVFHGETGWLQLTAPFNAGVFGEARLRLHRPDRSLQEWRFPAARQYEAQVQAFGAAIRTEAVFPWTLEDARGTQAMIDRVRAAS